MDWFTLLLIFIFFILPLIQQVLERSRKGGDVPEIETEEEWEVGGLESEQREREPAPAERSRREATEADVTDWSSDWGRWPGPEEESVPPEVEEPPERETPVFRVPEPVPIPPPPYRPVPKKVEPTKPAPESAAQVIRPARQRSAVLDRARSPRRVPDVAHLLHSHDDVRQAIVLAEVVGPPISLRTPGTHPANRA